MTYGDIDDRPAVSGWAVGALAFAGSLMIIIGAFSAIAGLAAIIDDDYFVVVRGYAFDLDVTAWGWIHLILGLAVLATGIGLLAGTGWAGIVAIVLAVLVAIDYFFFIPYAPFWSLLVIALCVWVIWAVTRVRASDT
jgi:hypothetical protein